MSHEAWYQEWVPVTEQRAIASVLDSIDKAIECTEDVIAATERLRESLLHELLARGLPGWRTEWREVPGFGPVPDGWKVVRLGDVAEVVGGGTPSRAKFEYWGGDTPWVVPSEITALSGRYLSTTRESISVYGSRAARLRMIPAGSVLLTSRATIGATAINTVPVATNQGFQSLIPGDKISGLWLYYVATSLKRELEKRAAGSTFREVSRESVRSIRIALPSRVEQKAIAAVLGSVDATIEEAQEKLRKLNLLKISAAESLLAGRIRCSIKDKIGQQ